VHSVRHLVKKCKKDFVFGEKNFKKGIESHVCFFNSNLTQNTNS
jgi:hypothetical protein